MSPVSQSMAGCQLLTMNWKLEELKHK